ncbi:unnamed protein product [Absidia cylindrospora]
MYPTQQVAYSLNNKRHQYHPHLQYHAAAKTDNNDLFFIGNQQLVYSSLPSMHQQHYHIQHGLSSTLHSSSSPSSIRFGSHLLPTTGHTLHWIDNALVSFFGKPNQSPISIIETKLSSSYISSPYLSSSSISSPCRRSAHTTTSIHDKNNTTQLYLIGGLATENDEPLADIWKLDWESKKWINLTTALGPFEPGLMGHVTLSLPLQSSMHLLSCFGANHRQHTFFQHCTLFNTNSLSWKRLQLSSSASSIPLPTPRIHTSMISTNESHAILYGGISSKRTLLDDLWWVDLSNIDSMGSTIMFTPLAHSIPRAGHVALMMSDSLMLVDGGQYDGSFEDGTAILDLAALEISPTLHRHQKRELESQSPAEGVAHDSIQSTSSPSSSSQGSSGLSSGVIGGIIVAVVLTLGVTITLFVFYQRRQRRQRNYDLHSRAVRFSLSTPPRPSESYIEQQRSSIIQHPDAAKTRLSHMSFGSDFYVGLDGEGSRSSASSLPRRSNAATTSTSSITPKSSTNNNHPNMLDSPSRQLYTNWVCETPVPPSAIAATTSEYNHNNLSGVLDPRHTSMYINQSTLSNSADHDHDESKDEDEDEGCAKKRSSTAFRRFRLSVFRPLDIGSSIAEQPGSVSQQQQEQQDQHNPTQIKSGACGPTSSTANHGDNVYDYQPTTNTTKRRSSMFGLSRFLNIGDSTTGSEQDQNQNHHDGLDQQNQQQQQVYPPYHRHHHQADTRASLGSKSVASLQWVEFNNDMDFDSGLASRHLAVMNHRQSVVTISSSSGFGSASVDDISLNSKPTSPRNTLIMTQQQQQPSFYQRSHQPSSSSSYRLGHRELQSWEDARMSWLGSSPPPPPHRLATRDPTKTNSFPTLAPLNID